MLFWQNFEKTGLKKKKYGKMSLALIKSANVRICKKKSELYLHCRLGLLYFLFQLLYFCYNERVVVFLSTNVLKYKHPYKYVILYANTNISISHKQNSEWFNNFSEIPQHQHTDTTTRNTT